MFIKFLKIIKDKFFEYWKMLNHDIYVGKRLERNLVTDTWVGLVVSLAGLVILIINIAFGRGFSTVFFTIVVFICGLLIAFSASVLKNRKIALAAALVISVFVFTWYTVRGVNEGFDILWTMLVPLAISYFGSVKYGIYLSVYYFILFVIVFYTPLRGYMGQFYSKMFMDCYPMLYLTAILLNTVAMLQYHAGIVSEDEYDEKLKEEVERQTAVAKERSEKLSIMSIQMVETLASAIDAKDKYTKGHSFRVSQYSVALAKALGWDDAEVEQLRAEALIHDIGKIGIPDAVLNKPGKLTDNEFMVIKSHTTIGGDILSSNASIPGAMLVARYHHERYDGTGYPAGLSGEDIPLHARIVAIADAYDAMRSDRIYRKGFPDEQIRSELIRGRGTQFQPDLLDVFLVLFDTGVLRQLDERSRKYRFMDMRIKTSMLLEKLCQERDALLESYGQELKDGGDELVPLRCMVENSSAGYGSPLSLLVVTLTPVRECPYDEMETAMQAMIFSTNKSLEGIGLAIRYGKNQLLVLIYDTSNDNMDMFLQRIYLDFFKLTDSARFELKSFELK